MPKKCDNATYNISSVRNCGLDIHGAFDTLFGLADRWLLGDYSFLLANTSKEREGERERERRKEREYKEKHS